MRTSRAVRAVIVSLVVVLIGLAVAGRLAAFGSGNPIATHPQPDLFPAATVKPLAVDLAAERPVADRDFTVWRRAHRAGDDAAFIAFAVDHTPTPANAAGRARELAEVRQLASARTARYVDASTWLELYGKTEIWKVYRKRYAAVRP